MLRESAVDFVRRNVDTKRLREHRRTLPGYDAAARVSMADMGWFGILVPEAYGGLGAVAVQAGISRESLYRALSPKGNPTLKTLVAVLKTVGLRLTVTPEKPVSARKAKAKRASVAA